MLIKDEAIFVLPPPLTDEEYVLALPYAEVAGDEENNEAKEAVNADNTVNTPSTRQRMAAIIAERYTMKFGTTYDLLTQETYPKNIPPKKTAKSNVNSVWVEKPIKPLAEKIDQNRDPINRNTPTTMNESINDDNEIFSSILFKNSDFAFNLAPHSEQKSPSSSTTLPQFGQVSFDITNHNTNCY